MKKIYVDLDSTLNDLETAWLTFCGTSSSMNVPEELTHWTWFQDTYGKKAMEFFTNINPYDIINVRDGAKEFIWECYQLDYDVTIISAHAVDREKEAKYKRQWLDENGFDELKLIVTHDKYKYTKDGILVDDNPKNCLQHIWNNHQPAYLFNYEDMFPYAKSLPTETYGGKLRYVTKLSQITRDLYERTELSNH